MGFCEGKAAVPEETLQEAMDPRCCVQGQMAQKLAENLDWERYLPQLSENDGFQWI